MKQMKEKILLALVNGVIIALAAATVFLIAYSLYLLFLFSRA